jgi:DNA-binding transcriptional ArsR family regulator
VLFWQAPNSSFAETRSDATNRVYKALADPTRRRILALLRERPMTAGELAGQFELSWPTMSGHFAVLREAGLVQADRSGTTLTYRLNQTVLQEALMALLDALGFDPAEPSR